MKEFFLLLLDKIEILTGIRQLERLQNKPLQLQELVDECVKSAGYYPIKEEIVKSVLMDAVSNDPDFIGLNVKWVRKTLNLYCQIHGLTKENQKEEVVDLVKAYTNYISFWQERKDLDPKGERILMACENLNRVKIGESPIDDIEAIKIMGGIYQEQIKNTFLASLDVPKGNGAKMREQLDEAGIVKPPPETSALEEACGVTEEMKNDSVTEQETNNPENI